MEPTHGLRLEQVIYESIDATPVDAVLPNGDRELIQEQPLAPGHFRR
jgi:hypothetical protein